VDLIQTRLAALDAIASELGVSPGEAPARLAKLIQEQKRLEASHTKLRQALALEQLNRLTPQQVDGVPVLANLLEDLNAESLRVLIDRFRSQHSSGVAVLASTQDGRPVIVAGVTEDLVQRGLHAVELVKSVAEVVGGGGGGRPTLAQAGGKDASKLPEALAQVPAWVAAHLT
jgi:alanyl-tRNA synthetase